jgi:YD repeat-containing protein
VFSQSCYIPTNQGQSVLGTVTDRSSGMQLHDGSIVSLSPQGNYADFHTAGTAYGYCTIMTPSCVTYVTTDYRGVGNLRLDVAVHSTNANFPFLQNGAVWPKDSTVHTSLDDHDTANSTGPIASMWILTPGAYSFRYTNNTIPTPCPVTPISVATSPITVYYYNAGSDKNLGRCHDGNGGPTKVGNPCDVATGNKYQEELDYQSSTLPLSRHYNSLMLLNFGLGYGWTTAYHRHLEIFGNTLNVRRADGHSEPFSLVNGSWTGDADSALSIIQDAGGFTVTVENGDTERYDVNGVIQSVQSPSGKIWTWTYDPQTNLLSSVSDSFGNVLGFQYGTDTLLHAVVLPGGGLIQYSYDANLNLTSATYPDNSTRLYLYENTGAGTNNQLTGIVDESGSRYATYSYSSIGQVSVSQHAGGADKVSLSYAYSSTAVTDALGVARTYSYQNILNARKTTAVSGTYCSQCGGTKSVTYDAQGNPTSRSDFNNVQTVYSYDLTRNLETSRTEAYGTGRARTITTQWNSSWRVPQLITELGRTTGFTYDSGGNLLTKTITDTSVTPNVSRTWTYTYDGYGHVLTIDGPRTDVSDVTTFTYYVCTTGSQCGQLHTATNPLGQTTTYNTYNVHGQPLTITDPNGVVTT